MNSQHKTKHLLFILAFIPIFTNAKSADPNLPDNAYLDGKDSKVGIVLCHGMGKYPNWDVVNPLRKGIHEQLGYHTLSIQMPVATGRGRDYIPLFSRCL